MADISIGSPKGITPHQSAERLLHRICGRSLLRLQSFFWYKLHLKGTTTSLFKELDNL
jgi:hypothetical protein